MPRNSTTQYGKRTYAAYTGANASAILVPNVPAAPPVHPLAIIPTGFTLARVTRVGWSLGGQTGAYDIRLVQISSAAGGVATPATRRIAFVASGSTFHRGPAVTVVVAPGTPIFAAWTSNGVTQNIGGMAQEAVLPNPIELQAGRGLAFEVSTLASGDGVFAGYIDWEEFR